MTCYSSALDLENSFWERYRKESRTESRCLFSSGSDRGSKSPSHSFASMLRSSIAARRALDIDPALAANDCESRFARIQRQTSNTRWEMEVAWGTPVRKPDFGGVRLSSVATPTQHTYTTQWLPQSRMVARRTCLLKFAFHYPRLHKRTSTFGSMTTAQISHSSSLHPRLIQHLQYL